MRLTVGTEGSGGGGIEVAIAEISEAVGISVLLAAFVVEDLSAPHVDTNVKGSMGNGQSRHLNDHLQFINNNKVDNDLPLNNWMR